ncbi:hypothetical protein EDB83DRAFT_2524103 [Lactarius deliciosus]|nr:hypothetical protein EDB83DRAFT_2524103 [Lactarius deliciosus]
MFEDNPLEPSPFVFDSNEVFATLADLDSFNFSSPSSGHRSPAFPTIPAIAEPQSELNNAWFNLSNINDDSLNNKSIASPDTPWDFLTFANDSPDSGATSATGAFSPAFAIDPQLMVTPATSKSPSDFGDEDATKDEHPVEEDDDDDDDDEPVTPPPIKPSNKGKDRKSGVLSGGVQKKIHFSSVVKTDPYDNPSDDWRPTPEEYQKMSSREKRQLRNKISARNFRNRRKEYITTLEGDVAERDRLIDVIRTELGSTRSENTALQQEIKALKKALLSSAGRANSPVLPPPSPLPISSRSSASTSPLLTPNTHKDLPATASPHLAAKGFWGGSSTFGGITPVHTVTIPDLIAGAALKPTLQENINPALNSNINSIGLSTLGGPGKPPPFDSFMDSNPFTMKMLDAYRMQLWTRMAQHQQQHQPAAASQHQQQQQQYPSSPPLSGLAANIRPHYFSSTPTLRGAASSSSLSSLLSGKHHIHTSAFSSASSSSAAASAYPTPPASPNPGSTSSAQMPTPQQAALATMASQTLVQRLGSAFWQAFSGSPSSYPPSSSSHTAPNARAPAWDAEKVRRVLEGTAVVRVVDIDPPSGAAEAVKATAAAASVVAVTESKEVQTQTQSQGQMACVKLCAVRETGLGVLEESMRALTLGKKGSA